MALLSRFDALRPVVELLVDHVGERNEGPPLVSKGPPWVALKRQPVEARDDQEPLIADQDLGMSVAEATVGERELEALAQSFELRECLTINININLGGRSDAPSDEDIHTSLEPFFQ